MPDLYIKIFDVKYEIKVKNKNQLSENRFIFFGLQKNLEIMDSKKAKEFYTDNILYSKIFGYLYTKYNFRPKNYS